MTRLAERPVHLGCSGTACSEPPITGPEWFEGYDLRHAADRSCARLVTQYSFTESWRVWEVHPHGAEVVVCAKGRITLIQQLANGREERLRLVAGDYAINPPGVWHTAELEEGMEATCIFVTPGAGTEHRAR